MGLQAEEMERGDGRPQPPASRRPASSIEWPTLLLAVIIYGGWLAVTWWHAVLPTWLVVGAGSWLIAWHGSLQHETIHGHPTGRHLPDTLIGAVPLALWLPYAHYRRTHLAHHAIRSVTDPFDDPEARYLAHTPGLAGALLRLSEGLQATLLGRLSLGPALTIGRFLLAETRRLSVEPRAVAREWLPHLAGVLVVGGWLAICDLPIIQYLLMFVYPGTSLTLLRSFAEHRAHARPGHRVAIVERAGPLALLFLNNNLHAAHHRNPGLAWYRLPALYRRHRADILRRNGGLLYRGYGEIARRYLLRAHDVLIHPRSPVDRDAPVTSRTASLAMYDHPGISGANDALWHVIARRLRAAGIDRVPEHLDRARPLTAIWDDPELLLAQACGYPLMTGWRGRLRYVATPRYRAEGCEGSMSASRIVVRRDDPARSLADLRDSRAAMNDATSNTGMNLFRAAIGDHAGGRRFFSTVIPTGSHRESARRVGFGEADVAAIDAVSFAQFQRHEPAIAHGLRTIAWTPTTPGLPLVTSIRTSRRDLTALRQALGEITRDPTLAPIRDALLIDGFDVLHAARYKRVLAIERHAVRSGYPALA